MNVEQPRPSASVSEDAADSPVRLLLVDDQALVRAGLRMVLDREPDLEVIGEAGTADQALRILEEGGVDVVLMDIQMPGMSGIEATRRIVERDLARVLMLTTFASEEYLFGALQAGASGFLVKTASAEDLVAAVHAVASGQALLSPEVTLPLIRRVSGGAERPALTAEDARRVGQLSAREREVLELVGAGRSNEEIAQELVLGMATVKTHVSSIFAKTDSRDRVQAVLFAHRTGLASL